jgi:hypothetical protein
MHTCQRSIEGGDCRATTQATRNQEAEHEESEGEEIEGVDWTGIEKVHEELLIAAAADATTTLLLCPRSSSWNVAVTSVMFALMLNIPLAPLNLSFAVSLTCSLALATPASAHSPLLPHCSIRPLLQSILLALITCSYHLSIVPVYFTNLISESES